MGVGGGPGTGQPQDHNLRDAPPVGRVSGLTKAAETSFLRARAAANHYSNEGLAGLARSSRIPTSGAGSGPSSRPWKLVAQGQRGVITIATRTSRGAELCTACSETSGHHWSAQAHHDNQGGDDQAGPVDGVWVGVSMKGLGSRFPLATLVGRDSPRKSIRTGLKPGVFPAAREGPTSCLPSALLHQFEFNAIWKSCAWLLALMLKN